MKSLVAAVLTLLVTCCYAKSIDRRMANCKPPQAQLTFTSSTVFAGVTCRNITNSNLQQSFFGANVHDKITITFDNVQFEIDASGGSSSVTCFGCTMGAELVAKVTLLIGSSSCHDSHNEWALAVRKFFDLVVNLTPHIMSVDIGENIEIRTMVPLVEVHQTDGSLVVATLPPTVGRTPQTKAPNPVTDPPIPVTDPTTPSVTTEPPTTASPSTEPPTTPAPCPAGSHLSGDTCRPCPFGQYNDQPGRSKCLKCPRGRTTAKKGSTSEDQCIGPCPRGHYSKDGNLPCDPCPLGSYQPFTGQTSCRKCLQGYTTTNTGMYSTLSCKRIPTPPPTTAPPTTQKTTAPPTTMATTVPPTTPPTPKISTRHISNDVGNITSANYPNNYNTMETTSWIVTCKGNAKSLVVMVLDVALATGDRLLLDGNRVTGPISLPEPHFYTPGGVNVTMVSDATRVAKGFNMVYACHDNSVKGIVRAATDDCSVRRFLRGNSVAIEKLLQLAKDPAVGFIRYASDPDIAPIIAIINSQRSTPC